MLKSHIVTTAAGSDIRISGVQFVDPSGTVADVFRKGRPVTIRIQYHALRPIVNPSFAVDIYHADGVYCAGINTRMEQRTFGTVEGDGHVDLVVDSRRLRRGCYVLSVGILDARGTRTFDVHHRAYQFSIAAILAMSAPAPSIAAGVTVNSALARAVGKRELVQ